MEENPYKAPANFTQLSRWPIPKWKWYEWIAVAIIVAILVALILPAKQSTHHHRRHRPATESRD